MQFKDYYAALGVAPEATADEIKRAYRKLARKYHPDVSQEKDAEARFKDVAEAYEALKETERRAAYDQVRQRWQQTGRAEPPPGWDAGFEWRGADADAAGGAADFSDFFEAIFGHARASGHHRARGAGLHARGEDHHAKVLVDLEDAYRGATRNISLQRPVADEQGRVRLQEHTLEIRIPKGIRAGQHLRLAGQGSPGLGEGPAGDLYLEVDFRPHRLYRVEGRDVSIDLPVAPWEAALGATVTVPTPDSTVEVRVPPGSRSGTRLRLKGKGLPGDPPGDFHAVLTIALPPADSASDQNAYRAFGAAFAGFDPREGLQE